MVAAEILVWVSIFLAIISATLAVAAFIFGWVSFRRTSDMHIETQKILAKISEKVESVVDRTSRQIDKAWDYLTRDTLVSEDSSKIEKEAEKITEKKLEPLRKEFDEVLKKLVKTDADHNRLRGLFEKAIDKTRKTTEESLEESIEARIKNLTIYELHKIKKEEGINANLLVSSIRSMSNLNPHKIIPVLEKMKKEGAITWEGGTRLRSIDIIYLS